MLKAKFKLTKHMKENHILKSKKERSTSDKNSEISYPCIHCGKIWHTSQSLKAHEKIHIPVRAEDYYHCDICGNKFRSKCPLTTHIKNRHILKIRFTCQYCPNSGKSWARKDHMKRHIKVSHFNIREFKCEWYDYICSLILVIK